MDEPKRNGRALRAVALSAAALIALAAASVVYLRSTTSSAPRVASTAPSTGPTVDPGPMYWLSANTGWVVLRRHLGRNDEVTLYHTTDGGHHWQRQFSFVGILPLLRFFDSGHGVMAARPVPLDTNPMRIYRTADSGTHWEALPALPDPNAVETFFVDAQHGWFISGNGTQSGDEYLTLYKTIDGGQHWVELLRVDAEHPVSGGVSQASFTGTLTFVDALRGWLETARPDGSQILYVTNDGGAQWLESPVPAPPGGWLANATRITGQVVTSPDGRGTLEVAEFPPPPGTLPRGWVFVTMDGGATWKDPVEVPAFVDPGLRDSFSLPEFAEARDGWLATQTATWTTGDSGRTWQRRSGLPGRWACRALTPVSARVSWCQGVPPDRILPNGRWELFRTTDGGRHWQQAPKPPIA
jgi:photosystem II stability/assembly factor-like uncharacterized protein